jgi:hypothetical protein
MIECWLQFTCDRCDETCNSTVPDMRVAEFCRDEHISRVDGKDLCKTCAKAVRAGR